MDGSFDKRAFRDALGQYATGVTVVSTMCDQGPLGMTANSFASVSMDPPLVLWSPARHSDRFPAFANATYYAIHILAEDQQYLSNGFAGAGLEPYQDTPYTTGLGDVPLFEGCAAHFICKKHAGYDGGDHLILVGEVVEMARSEKAPLVFHRGGYKHLG